jgi:hypothetical protein
MGDIFVAMTDDVQATSLRDGLIDQLIRLGNDDTVDNIVILAHSTGNLIAYDALATLQELSSSTPPDGANNSLTRQHNERIGNVLSVLAKTSSFVSIGSILTMAWSTGVTRASNNRYLRPIPEGIHWWNIWTRFDIATGSPLQLPEEHEHLPDPMNYHASNFGSLAFDHTAYWQNQEDVHFLLLEELGGRDSTNYFWRGRQSRQTRDPGSSEPRPVPAPSRFEQGDSDGRFENLKWVGRVLIVAHVIGLVMIILFVLFPGFARGSGEFLQIDHASSVVQFEWGSDVLQKDAKLNSIEELARSFFVGIVIWAIAASIWFVTMKLIYWHISMNGLHFRVTVRFFRWIRIDVDGWRSHRAAAFRETKRRSVVPE